MGVLYISVALISMSVLILEISFARIFSLLFEYHYAFLLISLAILGLGAGGIYDGLAGVKVVVEEGRNFIRRTKEKYDLIMLAIPVTKTSRSPEGYALTENFLFTV